MTLSGQDRAFTHIEWDKEMTDDFEDDISRNAQRLWSACASITTAAIAIMAMAGIVAHVI